MAEGNATAATATATAAGPAYVGVDVAKRELDVAVLPSGRTWRLAYGDEGLAALAAELAAMAPALVVVEATGGHERRLAAELHAAGVPVAVVNPARVRRLAQALGTLAKNDRLDSLNLARFAQVVKPRPQRPAKPGQADLDALVARRRQLVEMLTMEANRAKQPGGGGPAAASIAAVRAALEDQRRQVDKAVADLLRSDDEWDGKVALLTSVPGVGRTTAATLVAELPELGGLSRRAAASLTGLAPFDRDSGEARGRRFCRGGRASVRKVLHMATLTATTHNPVIARLYDRLRAAGKPFKVAMVACARKLLTILNAMVKANQHWKPELA